MPRSVEPSLEGRAIRLGGLIFLVVGLMYNEYIPMLIVILLLSIITANLCDLVKLKRAEGEETEDL